MRANSLARLKQLMNKTIITRSYCEQNAEDAETCVEKFREESKVPSGPIALAQN